MTEPEFDTGLMWFRRDLRLDDNTALYEALQRCKRVFCLFVFDTAILDPLPRADRRVEFICESLAELDQDLRKATSAGAGGLLVWHGLATECVPAVAQRLKVQAVFAAHDDEPHSTARDNRVRGRLAELGVGLHTCKDHLVFERREVLTQAGQPYGVFTPYKNAWLARLEQKGLAIHDLKPLWPRLAALPLEVGADLPQNLQSGVPSLAQIGFEATNLAALKIQAGASGAHKLVQDFVDRLDHYHQTRDFPAVKGPSYLGMHLRFGTVSIRRLVHLAMARKLHGSQGASVWLNELVWREFYAAVLANFSHVATRAFKPACDAIQWEHGKLAESRFAAWCQGQTGYPLVDAAMAQINQTGYMHNRLRMVAGSFMVKDLGLDWRWGEAYFATHLNDFDLASNNGGWQWVASTGCDAQPWFRIFNPITQSTRFDAQGKFIRRYLPQLAKLSDKLIHAPWTAPAAELQKAGVVLGGNYPQPLVDHAVAREKTLARYGRMKGA